MRTTLTALILGLLSLGFFLRDIGNPPRYVFDEFEYIPAANALLTHSPYTNPEAPPMGKLMIAAGIAFFGDNAFGWRIMSAVSGVFTLVGIFLWVLLLTGQHSVALIASLLTLLNNFLFVFSRTAMMDIYLVCFMVWALLAFTAALKLSGTRPTIRRALFLGSGVLFGFSSASKWNGVDTLGIAIAAAVFLLWFSARSSNPEISAYADRLRQAGVLWVVASLLIVPVLAYSITFLPVMHNLGHPFRFRELISMNVFIWHFRQVVVANRCMVTPWYQWPVQFQPLRNLSYLVGNWYVMWGGLAALLLCARRFGRCVPETLVIVLYAGNLLQWAITPQNGFFYYYYYFPAALFLGVAMALALRQFPERLFGVRLRILCALPAFVVFAYCFPRMANLPPPFDCTLGCWP